MKRLTLLADYAEEHWPSMEYVGEMLCAGLRQEYATQLEVRRYRPAFAAPWKRLRGHAGPTATNPDRFLNRYLAYPVAAALQRGHYWHVEDHSYAHLALATPAARTGVYVHDLDAVRCLFDVNLHVSPTYRRIARALLAGMQRAAVVFHSTHAVRQELLAARLLPAARLVHAPYGYATEFTLQGERQRLPDGAPYLLHVGSCIPRKRVDVLLESFALARQKLPQLQLVKVGGEWTPEHLQRIESLCLGPSLHHLQDLSRSQLASWYRGAAAVVLTSEAEGFGLPLIEALACGAPVIASALPVFEEVAGAALIKVAVGDAAGFAAAVHALVNGNAAPALPQRLAAAEPYSWQRHARIVGDAYLAL